MKIENKKTIQEKRKFNVQVRSIESIYFIYKMCNKEAEIGLRLDKSTTGTDVISRIIKLKRMEEFR